MPDIHGNQCPSCGEELDQDVLANIWVWYEPCPFCEAEIEMKVIEVELNLNVVDSPTG
jgi:hypothetical protein